MPPKPFTPVFNILIRVHCYLLLFILINALFRFTIHVGLHPAIMLTAKIIFFLSGASLFFLALKPFRKISLHFSVYILAPLIAFVSFLFGGILGAMALSILILPFYEPVSPTLKNGPYSIHEKYEGFFGAAGTYILYKNEYFILQKKIGTVNIDFDLLGNASFSVRNNTLILHVVKKTISTIPYKTDSLYLNGRTVYKTIQKEVQELKDTTMQIDIH